jgi:glycosyltransferase involved in cell wall biosynthesis
MGARNIEIIAALRVKNEARWISEVLRAINWCVAIYLMNDHSMDTTAEIAREGGAVVLDSPFADFNEARDKTWLVGKVAEKHKSGTWVLMIDGDEILEPEGPRKIIKWISRNPYVPSFSLHVKYLWDSPTKIRVDGVFGRRDRPSLFRLTNEYAFTGWGPNGLHCSCAPARLKRGFARSNVNLLHLGYKDKSDRINNWKYYNSIDPENIREGYDPKHPERGAYPHIVQGDIPEVPANIRLKHAGPLELRPL